jgi:hypothetical protein
MIMPNTLRESWESTLRLTYGTARFHFTSKRGRIISRVVTILALIFIGSSVLWAIVTPVWFAWRVFRTYERVVARNARKRALKGTVSAVKRERRKFSMTIEIG